MTRRRIRWIKRLTAAVAVGWVFGSLSCVQNVADTVGTGLNLTSATGILGPASQSVNAIGAGFDLFSSIARFSPIGH